MWHDHTYLGPTPKIYYVPDKDLTFPASNLLFLDKDIWELPGASKDIVTIFGKPITLLDNSVAESNPNCLSTRIAMYWLLQ